MNLFKQRGSVFGLDARVALIIFTVLTLVSGYTGIKAYSQVKAQGFAAELRAIAKASSQLQADFGAINCTTACAGPNCMQRDNYMRLMSVDSVDSDCSSRWNGPYITPHAIPHPNYGTGYIYAYTAAWNTACTSGTPCYLWMVWDAVNLSEDVLEKVNDTFDGTGEGSPSTAGMFRWEDNGADTFTVRYRLARSIGN